ncbi:MAG: S-methyl-5-thioribose-1-phosphate isomerase [Oscillospiraceae bacterium]|jgi:methylthioribose-1-phosphate isomerase|nr:S-methyl-5-thioribose-1-phosphate isomerase [Oscillospiraceae bacterium]
MNQKLTPSELGANPSVRLSDDGASVVIIDQTLLPRETKIPALQSIEEMYDAIFKLRVRGAPAIGIFAAYCVAVLAAHSAARDFTAFTDELRAHIRYLDASRPTAVNLGKQLRRMERVLGAQSDITTAVETLQSEAFAIHREDIAMCRAISEFGVTLLRDGDGVLTHCNAGPLATSRYGTGLGPILMAHERGMTLHAYVDETRPLLQGARLTAYELYNAGVDTTLICDNMASIVMREGRVNAAFVGCDRVAMNGDAANKIGTSGVAILCKHYGIPLYVCCPSSTIDPNCATGDDIVIEQRDGDEIAEMFYANRVAPVGVKCYNPAFDVTPHGLITAIITEKGILREPYDLAINS